MPDLTGFLGKSTAGLPNWAWGAIIVAGIGAAYIVPKFLGSKSSNPLQASADQSKAAGASGLGLAIDPTTGLPYAVEGLVPSGAGSQAGVFSSPLPPIPSPVPTPGPVSTNPTLPAGTRVAAGAQGRVWYTTPGGTQQLLSGPNGAGFCAGCITQTQQNGSVLARMPSTQNWWLLVPPSGHSTTRTPGEEAHYISVARWPYEQTTLPALASKHRVSLAKLQSLNPSIRPGSIVYAGQTIRVA